MVAAAGALVTKMVIAAFSGMGAATICHPLDVVRVQMQTEGAYKNAIDCGSQVIKREGIKKGLYAGISAAYLRQWLYGSCRIGIYAFLLEKAQQKKYFFRSAQEPNRVRSKTVDGYDQRRYRELCRNTLRISVGPYVK